MLINQLPDDCFLTIFNYMNNVDDLINCFKDGNNYANNSLDCVYYYQRGKRVDGSYLKTLFTNLMIVQFKDQFSQQIKYKDIVSMVKNQKSLIGLIVDKLVGPMTENFDRIEMLATKYFGLISKQNAHTKQLHIKDDSTIFMEFHRAAKYFPNLERIHIHGQGPWYIHYCEALEKLKIIEVEVFGSDIDEVDVNFDFIDLCPNLQSAYICIPSGRFRVNESLKTNNLQDLVINFGSCKREVNCNDLERLLIKCPNLKHLALRHSRIKDEHIMQLVFILPDLVLFDVFGCREVTQRAADFVQKYWERHGRSIKFYFNENHCEIESDWPQLSIKKEKIGRGFDFMKHCFLKQFDDLPYFLIPNDD